MLAHVQIHFPKWRRSCYDVDTK